MKMTREERDRKVDELYNQFLAECEEIADQCEEEGYPSHGSNYDLRCDDAWNWYKPAIDELYDVELID